MEAVKIDASVVMADGEIFRFERHGDTITVSTRSGADLVTVPIDGPPTYDLVKGIVQGYRRGFQDAAKTQRTCQEIAALTVINHIAHELATIRPILLDHDRIEADTVRTLARLGWVRASEQTKEP